MDRKAKLVPVFFIFLFLIGTSHSAANFTLVEGDLVRITPSAVDPDGDKVLFYFSPPLNESGEWQTGFGDAGVYHTKVVASDGRAKDEMDVILTILEKNRPPQITSNKITVYEGEQVELKSLFFDPNEDPLKFIFEAPFDQEGLWTPSYSDSGSYTTKVTASDLEFKITETIEVEVKDKNRLPRIISSFADNLLQENDKLITKENTTFSFYVSAEDPDNDPLTYLWKLNGEKISRSNSFDYYFDFESSGEYEVLLTLSDHKEQVHYSWKLRVENVNRPPVLNLSDLIIREGERVDLALPSVDADGEAVSYEISPPLNKDGTWQTGYADSGEYEIRVIASDGKLETEQVTTITVLDVDRAPEFSLEKEYFLHEGEQFVLDFSLLVSDPDGDEISFTAENIPEGADFSAGRLEWTPSFDFIQRKTNFFSDLLNRWRIEDYFYKLEKKAELTVIACGRDLCASQDLILKVINVNQPPVLEEIPEIILTETETALIIPQADDPDYDYVAYSFGKPFDREGKWKTSHGDAGEYFVEVAVSDGKDTSSQQVKVKVIKKNRPPEMKIKKDYFKINEQEELSFKVGASDPDGDNLTIYAENLPEGASFQEQIFTWKPSFDSVQERKPTFMNRFYSRSEFLNRRLNSEYVQYLVDFIVTDGEFYLTHPVLITVKNVNRKPVIEAFYPPKAITTTVGQPIIYSVNATDPDGDDLTYTWSFGFWEGTIKGPEGIQRTFKTPGTKKIAVTVSDGTSRVKQEWKVKVVAGKIGEPVNQTGNS